MSRKSIKRLARDAVAAHLTTQAGSELDGIQVVSTRSGNTLTTRHIRITTSVSEPQAAGETNLARWSVTCAIGAVTQIDDYTEDDHDDLTGLIEAYVLQDNKTLSAALTSADLVVDNVMIGNGAEQQNESLRYDTQEITLECYIPAA
jgi:hypothetical protein